MTILFQDENENILFRTEDSIIAPNVDESVNIEGKWYKVVERVYRYKRLNYMDDNTCYISVKEEQ
jgi:hypothetical protein